MAVAAFLVGAPIAPIEDSATVPVAATDRGQAITEASRVLLHVDAAALDEASWHARAALSPGAAVTLLGDAGAADGRLLNVSRSSADGVSVDVRLWRPVGFGVPTSDRAVLRIPAGSRRVAAALAELVLPTAFE